MESSKPEVEPNPLPVCNLLAETAPTEYLQQEPKHEEPDVTTTTSTLVITEVAKEAIAVQLSQITGISLPISHLCLSQSDYDQAIALEAINFAADFASANGLALQASILCLDNSLWNMEHAALLAGSVVKEVSQKTGITMDLAIEFLYLNDWKVKQALEGFEEIKVGQGIPISFSYFSTSTLLAPFFEICFPTKHKGFWLRGTPPFFFRIFCRVRLSKNRPDFFSNFLDITQPKGDFSMELWCLWTNVGGAGEEGESVPLPFFLFFFFSQQGRLFLMVE